MAGSSPSLYARVMLPPGANLKKCSRKYPMLFYVYGGPYSQMVKIIIFFLCGVLFI